MIPARLRWLNDLDQPHMELARLFSGAGHELALVGGSVRDAMLGVPHDDLDFTTDARPADVKRIVAQWADDVVGVGEAFGTVLVIKGGAEYEITTYRSEVYRSESRKPEVEYSNDLETDLSRRDFTVNAMAVRLPGVEIVDPHGGLSDLNSKVLRTPLDPTIAFSDDPLRMLRLYRFVATTGFEADPEAETAVGAMAERLEIISAERVRDELSKLLVGDDVARGLRGIVDSGLAIHFLPELAALQMEVDPVHHHKDVLAHTIAVVENTEPKLRIRLAALLHDIGKPETRAFGPGGATFHHHEVVGARLARRRMRELRYPKELVEEVGQLVFLHLRPHTFKMGWTDSAVRRYVRDAGSLLEDLNQLVRCDVTTANPARARAIQRGIDELEERIADLAKREELASLRPPVDGHDIMRHLGLEPGPLVGEVMRVLTEHRIEEGPYPPEEAYALARAWAKDKGLDVPK